MISRIDSRTPLTPTDAMSQLVRAQGRGLTATRSPPLGNSSLSLTDARPFIDDPLPVRRLARSPSLLGEVGSAPVARLFIGDGVGDDELSASEAGLGARQRVHLVIVRPLEEGGRCGPGPLLSDELPVHRRRVSGRTRNAPHASRRSTLLAAARNALSEAR